jgi:LmbE family N-acetylglucosaminyl deacetylase
MNRRVLAIGAHPDDIELGCGGAILQHVLSGDQVSMLIMTNGEVGPGMVSERVSEQRRACDILGVDDLIWGNIPDCKVSLYELEVVHTIEAAIRQSQAEIIYTHSMSDSHQDHRAVAAATTGAARKCGTILSYDAPSSINFRPTVFVDVASVMDKKIEALFCHASQVEASDMVDDQRVRAQATYRGHEARLLAAEAFEPIRATWSI